MAGTRQAQGPAKSEPGRLSRDLILNTAAELFERDGYRKTRLEDLAQLLHVTRPALYYHFKAKQDILVAIEFRALDRLAEVAEAVDREQLPASELFWRHIEAHATYVASHPVEAGIVFEEEEELPDEVKTEVRRRRRAYTRRLVKLYSEAIAAGEAPAGDARLAVNTILGAATWVYRWYRDGVWGDPAAAAAEIVRVLRAGSGTAVSGR